MLAYLDQLTNAIPVALVICLILSTYLSVMRLRDKNIFVSEYPRLNMAGLVTVACFDKTGELAKRLMDEVKNLFSNHFHDIPLLFYVFVGMCRCVQEYLHIYVYIYI